MARHRRRPCAKLRASAPVARRGAGLLVYVACFGVRRGRAVCGSRRPMERRAAEGRPRREPKRIRAAWHRHLACRHRHASAGMAVLIPCTRRFDPCSDCIWGVARGCRVVSLASQPLNPTGRQCVILVEHSEGVIHNLVGRACEASDPHGRQRRRSALGCKRSCRQSENRIAVRPDSRLKHC